MPGSNIDPCGMYDCGLGLALSIGIAYCTKPGRGGGGEGEGRCCGTTRQAATPATPKDECAGPL